MSSGPQSAQQQDNSMAMLWIVVLILLSLGAIWYLFSGPIAHFIFAIRAFEMKGIAPFLSYLPKSYQASFDAITEYLSAGVYYDLTVNKVAWVSQIVGQFYRFPIAFILIGLAIVIYRCDPAQDFCKTLNMEKLVAQEVGNWPQIIPVSQLNLVKVPLEEGPWAMAMTSVAFSRAHHLLAEETPGPEHVVFDPRKKRTPTLLPEKAAEVFAMQLGRHWHSVEDLPIHRRALFAVFAARMMGDREAAANLLSQISRSAAKGHLDFSGADALLKKHLNTPLVQRNIHSHAYEYTVFSQMLASARLDGVLATADFLWLKPLDRPLWYTLNNVGRQTAFPEVAGVHAHWLAEKEIGRPLSSPMVEEAVGALAEGLEELLYVPPPEKTHV